MTLWDFKSRIYSRIRKIWPLKLLLDGELNNLKVLAAEVSDHSDTVLDLGCGSGDGLAVFPDTKKLVCLDASFSMLRRLLFRYPDAKSIQANAGELPLKNGKFLLISAMGLLEYLPDIKQFLTDCFSLSTPGGHLLLTSARPNLLNRIRQCSGHRVFTRNHQKVLSVAEHSGWTLINQKQSLLQDQFLFRRPA